ncbi:Transcriptional elongation regulator MINIYO [Quillaja saponaria]|uniref:Transcriptional elongation regulator MINIYO n=1 Tax=Quillaja saponaria TaxID=32244 RepID=A0AAD7M4H9_QUISA|nr:Transcriptional elongation regulator MINIYO [Quillaja saponaria]
MQATTSLGINENDASFFIGGIFEKGFSDDQLKKPTAIPSPKPTVFPFPIARHRSHGPHWGPIGSKKGNDEDNEDKDFVQFEAVAGFANTIEKKNGKGLDFSRWKELVPVSETVEKRNSSFSDEDMFASVEMAEQNLELRSLNKPKEAKTIRWDDRFPDSVTNMDLDNSYQLYLRENVKDAGFCNYSAEPQLVPEGKRASFARMSHNNFGLSNILRKEEQNNLVADTVSCSTSKEYGDEQVSMSSESQIDVENRAWLEQMSAEEVAQASLR